MTYKEIQEMNILQPYCFETDREEEWYNAGLVDGADIGYVQGVEDTLKSLWKDAQGDDLPAINREVIAFQGRMVVFAHRPDPKGFNGKSPVTGEVKHYTTQTYGKGGWNMPDVKYWLDVELPKDIE